MNTPQKIWAIVPAHNEEETIAQTIEDLVNQTITVNILVVLDNCSDNTEKIVKNLIPKHPNLFCYKTKGNRKKKAGAINKALEILDKKEMEAVLLMDADTRIDKEAVEQAYRKLQTDPLLAAICSKAGVLPFKGKNLFEWFLYQVQKLEYCTFDSQRIETFNAIKVVHGMAGLHRWSALKEAGGFDDCNLVEDYDLTIRYKMLGYKTTVELKMKAWTELPSSLKDWWKQRLRWNRGGLDTLKKHGWNNITKKYILQHFTMFILVSMQWFFLIMFFQMLLKGSLVMHGIVIVVSILGMLSSIYRLKFLEEQTFLSYVFRILVIPEFIYEQLINMNQLHSYYLFITNQPQSW